jgi:DNA-binding PadR family transcriptional regulator
MTDHEKMPHEVAEWLPLQPRIFAILLVLARGRRHGYRLMQDLRDGEAGERWDVGPATLYRTLRDLERRGLISGRTAPTGASGGPPRREYAMTERGRVVAAAETARMERLVAMAATRRLAEQR